MKVQNPVDVKTSEVAIEPLDVTELANVYGGKDDDKATCGNTIGFGCKCTNHPTKPQEPDQPIKPEN